jgi:deoxycytidylate deaminase
MDKSNLVFGLVAPFGVDWGPVLGALESKISDFDCSAVVIDVVSDLVPPLNKAARDELEKIYRGESKGDGDPTTSYVDARIKIHQGNTACRADPSALAKLTAKAIDGYQTATRTVFVVKSLKRPEEYTELRRRFGQRFFLLAFHCAEEIRQMRLEQRGMHPEEVTRLIEIDRDERGATGGQRTGETFALADVFFACAPGIAEDQIERFLQLVFQNQFITPSRDEYAMFMAHAAAARSGSLARQVGAVIVDEHGDILAAGSNEAPRAGGGLHWPDEMDARDTVRGFDSNRAELTRIALDMAAALKKTLPVPEGTIRDALLKTQLKSIIEYMREVHAEMSALLACARNGVSTKGRTLYCTTFPCHCCAKEIIEAGIKRIIFVEPYPKSRALHLHDDAISFTDSCSRVVLQPFIGVNARRYLEFFSLSLGVWNHDELGTGVGNEAKHGKKKNERKNGDGAKLELLPKARRQHRYGMTDPGDQAAAASSKPHEGEAKEEEENQLEEGEEKPEGQD